MSTVSKMELGRELMRTLSQINHQIETIKAQAAEWGVSSAEMRDTDGGYVLAPLLVAKANCLHGLSLINNRHPY